MKKSALIFCLFSASVAFAQEFNPTPDTILVETFEVDPTESMLTVPTGNDDLWVNFDFDGLPPSEPGVPLNWYWESDFGDSIDNYAYTSTSYLDSPFWKNRNWLITPKITIPDSAYYLCWRSLSFQGPAYHDGYKVLVSTTNNDVTLSPFADTLFKMAQMTQIFTSNPNDLNLSSYAFSPGYIHADGYTKTEYFYKVTEDLPGGGTGMNYRGRFEPHSISLAAYAGKSVYIAFLHDSDDDNILQIDDIIISNEHTVSTQFLPDMVEQFSIRPSLVTIDCYATARLKKTSAGEMTLFDAQGRKLHTHGFSETDQPLVHFDFYGYPSGIYYVNLRGNGFNVTEKLIKL